MRLLEILGIDLNKVSHGERLASALGAFLGIACVFFVSRYFVGEGAALLVVASMGASAVLLFAVPHGPLSQPWPLVGGHIISALAGVSCAKWIPNVYLAAPVAVGLAVGAMHYLRCIHPPGGATALTAVAGGPAVLALGYQFVLTPVAVNVAAIIFVAIVYNFFLPWRRYPYYLNRVLMKTPVIRAGGQDGISHEDFAYALTEIDSFIDITEDDLMRIYELALAHQGNRHLDPESLKLGSYYSNGRYGKDWSVRQIVDCDDSGESQSRKLIYKVIAGGDTRTSGVNTFDEFAKWARYEVFPYENSWRRVPSKKSP
ncbi:MAG: HPP family protein [Gammaproteobacteria bacterium]|nr:HPP family protein [Gammaproteobacteria bacterium]